MKIDFTCIVNCVTYSTRLNAVYLLDNCDKYTVTFAVIYI